VSDYRTSDPIEREILDYMKEHPRVTSKDIAQNCSVGEVARLRAFRNLRRAGVVKEAGRDGKAWLWSVFELGDIQVRAAQKRSGKDGAIWAAMRTLNVFCPEDIMTALAGGGLDITRSDIQSYCTTLVQSKYLSVLARAKPGTSSARYRLVKNTGPLPPVRKRMTVLVDPNEDRIVFAAGERI